MVNKLPKFIKFIYRNKERLWVRVVKFEHNYYYGYIDNKPISKGISSGQYIRVHKNKVLEKIQIRFYRNVLLHIIIILEKQRNNFLSKLKKNTRRDRGNFESQSL